MIPAPVAAAFATNPVTMPLAIAASIGSLLSGRKQHKQEKIKAVMDAKQRILQARAQRVQVIKERRAAQAALNVQAGATGTSGSSGVLGAGASLAAQQGASIATSEAFDLFGHVAARADFTSHREQWYGSQFNSVFNLALSGMDPVPKTGVDATKPATS
jgi:hypothetical protein